MFIIAFGVINKELLSATQQGYQVNMGTPGLGLASQNVISSIWVHLSHKLNSVVGTDSYIADGYGNQFNEEGLLVDKQHENGFLGSIRLRMVIVVTFQCG